MTILEFVERFSDELTCKEVFRDLRRKQGVVCKRCDCTTHYWLQAKWQFQCKSCSFRTTLKSGTVMENSRLSYRKWFLIMLFMTTSKKGISACELQRQLGHKRYTTIWSIMHRLRNVMGQRDALYQLHDMIELDEGYFEVEVPDRIKSNLKRGKGSQRQSNVAVMAESTPLENVVTGEVSNQCRYFKMKVLKNHKSSEIEAEVQQSIDSMSIVFTDKSTSYLDIEDYIETHVSFKSDEKTTQQILKWVHVAISNAKRTFLGVYHKINGSYLQSYLNEFVYKLNRRYMKSVFERLLIAVTSPNWQTNG